MLQTWKCFVCDSCSAAIDYYQGSNELATKLAKEAGIVFKKGKHFCSKECEANYQLTPPPNN